MRLVILGDPVDHSLSPQLHTAAFAVTGLFGEYGRRRVDAGGMSQAVDQVRSGDLSGANVTMPHKELAARLVDRLAESARRVKAVNTLVHSAGSVVGHNTDVVGVRAAWDEAGLPQGCPALVLGAGGAAAAALVALEDADVHIAARRGEAASELSQRVDVPAPVRGWGEPLADAVVVNATPLGMRGERLPDRILGCATGLFDMAYGSNATPAVLDARKMGIPVADGRSMLVHQAAAAFELWTGHAAPVDAMRVALSPDRSLG